MSAAFEIFVTTDFAAAHKLCGYDGPCSATHGHNWEVTVYVRCLELDRTGMGVDFMEIKRTVDQVIEELDHQNLNDLLPFREENPTAEVLARHIFQQVAKGIDTPGVSVSRVTVTETKGMGVTYSEEE